MVLLERLKAWGAVEKNGRRLRMIKSSIGGGFAVGFGLLDMLLSRLQHGNLAPVQRVACALQWVNVVTARFMPEHIRDYVAWHCATSEISIPTIARIYFMLKITIAILASIIITFNFMILIISGDKLSIKYLYYDIKGINFDFVVYSNKKTLLRTLFYSYPFIFMLIYGDFYVVLYINNLKHIDFPINFASTSGFWLCMLIPSAIIRNIYIASRLMSGDEPTKQ